MSSKHGTLEMYRRRGCRCNRCTNVHQKVMRLAREAATGVVHRTRKNKYYNDDAMTKAEYERERERPAPRRASPRHEFSPSRQ